MISPVYEYHREEIEKVEEFFTVDFFIQYFLFVKINKIECLLIKFNSILTVV